MANPIKGEALLRLSDGRQFTLVLDFDGLIAAEAAYGKPLKLLLGDLQQGFLGATRALLLGALNRNHSGLAIGEVSAMLLSDQQAVGEALGAAVQAAFPDAKPAGEAASGSAEGNAPTAPASKRSSRSGAKRG